MTTPPRTLPRTARWAAAAIGVPGRPAALLTLATLVAAPVFAAGLPVGRQLQVFWVAVLACDLVIVAGGALVARRLAAAHHRRFWWALVFAGGAFLAGDGLFALGALGHPPGLAVAGPARSLTSLAGVGVVAWVLLSYPAGRRSRRERAAYWLDTWTILVGAAAFRWYLSTHDRAVDAGELAGVVATTAALLLAAFAGARMVASGDAAIARTPAVLLIASTALEASYDGLFALPDGPGTGTTGWLMWLRLLPSCGAALAVAAQLPLVRAGRPAPPRPVRARGVPVWPYVMVALVFGLLVVALVEVRLGAAAVGVLVAALATVALVVARQLLSMAENAALLTTVQSHERRQRALLRHSSDITSIIGPDHRISYVSPAVSRVLGHPVDEVTGAPAVAHLHPDDRAELAPLFEELLAEPGATRTYQARYRHADGSWRWLEVIVTNLVDQPDVRGLVSNSREVTQARELQEQLRHEASHDALTELANRTLFQQRLAEELAGWEPDGASVSVLVVDLDDFKQINDTLGHHAGDEALILLADVLSGCVRRPDLPARLGGDEFAVLLPQTTAGEATLVAQRFLDSLEQPVIVSGQSLQLHASVGVAAATGPEVDRLLRAADEAMYLAKQRGKHQYVVHDPWSRAGER